MKLNVKELRVSQPTKSDLAKIKRREIYIICDNILDTYNIGSIFRLGDAVGVKKIFLCGQSETPPNSRIAKAAVGTEKWVPWQYERTAKDAVFRVKEIKSQRVKVVAIEQTPKSIDFRDVNYQQLVTSNQALAFIVGHETNGVSKETL